MKTPSHHTKARLLKWVCAALLLLGVFVLISHLSGRLDSTFEALTPAPSKTFAYASSRLDFSIEMPQFVAADDAGCHVETSQFPGDESVISYRPDISLVPLVVLESSTTNSLFIAPSYFYSLGGESDYAVDGKLITNNAEPTFGEYSMCKRMMTTLDNIHDRDVFIRLVEEKVTSDADLERLATDYFLCDVGQQLPDSQAGVYDVTLKCGQFHFDPTDTDYRIKYFPAKQEAVFFQLTGPRGCQFFLSVSDLENPAENPTCDDGMIIKTLKFN